MPQQIYLTDDSISSNIAFGIDPKYIDEKMLNMLLRLQIYMILLIMNYQRKYQTKVGERGVKDCLVVNVRE